MATTTDDVREAEQRFLWAAVQELKRWSPAELIVSMDRDPTTGEVEIIYARIVRKLQPDEGLRRVYRARKATANGVKHA